MGREIEGGGLDNGNFSHYFTARHKNAKFTIRISGGSLLSMNIGYNLRDLQPLYP